MRNKKRLIPKVTFNTNEEYYILETINSDEFKSLFYNMTLESISSDYNKEKCVLFKIANTQENVLINKESYSNALQEANKFFVIKEDYEKCSQIKTLLEKL